MVSKIRHTKLEAYEQAVAFRKRGFTYSEIAKICNVSRGTVSNWLKHESFSKQVATDNAKKATKENKKRLLLINKARVAERGLQYKKALKTAETEYRYYRHHPLFIAGLTLYLTLGDLDNERVIRLSSAKTAFHQLFLRFLIEFLAIEKTSIRFWLLLYPDLDEVTCMKHWCKKIGLSPAHFHKNQVVLGRAQHKTLHFGVGNTIIGSTLHKKKLIRWTELLAKEVKIQ
jgi:transcriptional regulator with XRE-family HTH domain